MEQSTTKERLLLWWKLARQPESWPLEICFLIALAVVWKSIEKPEVVMTSVAWGAGILTNFVSHPLVLTAFLLYALWVFQRGVSRLSLAKEKAIREVEEIRQTDNQLSLKAITKEREVISQYQAKIEWLPYVMTKAVTMGRDIDNLQNYIQTVKSKLKEQRDLLEPFFGDAIVPALRHGTPDWSRFSGAYQITATTFEAPCLDGQFENNVMHKSEVNSTPLSPGNSYGMYDPALNEPFQVAQRRNLAKVEKHIEISEGVLTAQRRTLMELRHKIDQEVLARGYTI